MAEATPLKLLVVGLSWPPETFLERLIRGLVEAGQEVVVATPRRPEGVPVQWIRTTRWGGSTPARILRSILAAGSAWVRSPHEWKLIRQGNPAASPGRRVQTAHDLAPLVGRDWDVAYFPWNSAAAAHLPIFRLHRPTVVSCRGSQMNIAPANPRRREEVNRYLAALDAATAVHCVSDALRRVVEAQGIAGDKIRVIRPAVDPEFFSPGRSERADAKELRLVTTGSLIWRKSHETLLVSIRHLLDAGTRVRLRVIGDGVERERVAYTIRDLRLEKDVDLLGEMDEGGIREELRAADLFLLASLSEGISNAVLEAMSCGLPVVSSEVGGMAEAIADGVEGLLVPPGEPHAMTAAIQRLQADGELRLRLGHAARRRVIEQFSLDRHIQAWCDLLAAAAERNVGHPR